MVNACQLFRIWLGVTEYLYRNDALLSEAIDTAIDDHSFRSDDLEFTFAARVSPRTSSLAKQAILTLQAWSECVSFGSFEAYRDRFEHIQSYFAPRFDDAVRMGNEMIKTIVQNTKT